MPEPALPFSLSRSTNRLPLARVESVALNNGRLVGERIAIDSIVVSSPTFVVVNDEFGGNIGRIQNLSEGGFDLVDKKTGKRSKNIFAKVATAKIEGHAAAVVIKKNKPVDK